MGGSRNGLDEEFSADECAEVRDILELHRALHLSAMKVGVEPDKVRFRGFDGNNETAQMAYTRYLLFLILVRISQGELADGLVLPSAMR